MTNPDTMKLWSPQGLLPNSLQRVEVHLTAKTAAIDSYYIKYTFTELAGEGIQVSNNVDDLAFCTCFDERWLKCWNIGEKRDYDERNVIDVAARFVQRRSERLKEDDGMRGLGRVYFPNRPKCDECGLDTFSELGVF
jgi:hypothetical protein